MSKAAAEFDLFLDESGDFRETSTDPTELAESHRRPRVFASQIAGVLVRRGALTTGTVRAVLHRALKQQGLLAGPVHANQLPRHAYDGVVGSVVSEVVSRGWQPVRVVNRERVRYGDRAATYTNMVAELVLRVCQQLAMAGESSIGLRLRCARVVLREEPDGTIVFLDRDEYLAMVHHYLGFAAVRRGLSQQSAAWRLDGLVLGSGKEEPELQLCDVLSHASHDNFSPCADEATKNALRTAFGAFDFTLSVRALNERVDQLLTDDSLGEAIQALAVELIRPDLPHDARADAQQRLDTAVRRLGEIGAPARDSHLQVLVNWLEQIIELQRALGVSAQLADWLRTEVLIPLCQVLAGGPDATSVDWFEYALHTWALTACNHLGSLVSARRAVDGLKPLLPTLAGRWEHVPLLMRGLVAEAVHRTDCFEPDEASERMRLVASYYETLGSLFDAAFRGVFPDRVRAEVCGQALGTQLQSEIHAGLLDEDRERLVRARALSDKAIEEFTAAANRERQYQYRCQLETAAGAFADARCWLARSLRVESADHLALATAIGGLVAVSPIAQGFAQLHWLRLGATALLDGEEDERADFFKALQATQALDWPWSVGGHGDGYPVHGILRRVAVAHAALGQTGRAVDALRRLTKVTDGREREGAALAAIRLAAHAEVAVTLWDVQSKAARKLLDSSDNQIPGALQQLERLKTRTAETFPRLWAVFATWPTVIGRALQSEAPARSELIRLARRIGY